MTRTAEKQQKMGNGCRFLFQDDTETHLKRGSQPEMFQGLLRHLRFFLIPPLEQGQLLFEQLHLLLETPDYHLRVNFLVDLDCVADARHPLRKPGKRFRVEGLMQMLTEKSMKQQKEI